MRSLRILSSHPGRLQILQASKRLQKGLGKPRCRKEEFMSQHWCIECGEWGCDCDYKCGHVRNTAGIPEPACPQCFENQKIYALALDILNANPKLSVKDAGDYAARILWAESRENFHAMTFLLNEAIYGDRNAA
jgi:hypothetical protein